MNSVYLFYGLKPQKIKICIHMQNLIKINYIFQETTMFAFIVDLTQCYTQKLIAKVWNDSQIKFLHFTSIYNLKSKQTHLNFHMNKEILILKYEKGRGDTWW